MTFIRLVSLYGLYFIACMFAVVTVLQDWSDGTQALFAFVVPGLLVWVGERRRSARKNPKPHKPKPSPERLPVGGSHPLTRGAVGKNASWMEPKYSKGWIPKNETVDIGGRNLGGMIYVGAPPLLSPGGYSKCR
ncbi:hypothetical protein, partial [Parvibaculum sp.]